MAQQRHPKGSPLGGRYARSSRPADVPTDKLTLNACIDLSATAPSSANLPLWDSTEVDHAFDLISYVSEDQHAAVAISQLPYADTTAEMWYQVCAGSQKAEVSRQLRGCDDPQPLPSTPIILAKSLQRSILDSDVPQGCVVYRGMVNTSDEDMWHIAQTSQIGDRIRSTGFWSASTEPATATDFAICKGDQMAAAIFRIETQKGKFLLGSSNAARSSETELWEEQEVVLPHGAIYEVVGRQPIQSYDVANRPTLLSLRAVGIEDTGGFDSLSSVDNLDLDDLSLSMLRDVTLMRGEEMRETMQRLLGEYATAGLPLGDRTTSFSAA